MPLYGTLRTMPLRDLLQWIAQAGNTGTLQVERDRVRRWLVFRDGHIVSATSDAPSARLGHFLLAQGRISEDQLRCALESQASTGHQLGTVFVDMGALSAEELASHLKGQAEETVFSLFDSNDAVFRFHEQVRDEPGFQVDLTVEQVVRQGEERFAKLQCIREVFPDHQVVLRRGSQSPPDAVLKNPMAAHLFEAIDGSRTIAEIVLHVHGSEFMVTRFLYELHRAGFVEVAETEVAPARTDDAESARLPCPAPTEAEPVAATAQAPAADAAAQVAAASSEPTLPAPAMALDVAAVLNRSSEPVSGPAEDDLEWSDDPLDEHSELLDIPDVFAESSDVEALEDSVAYQVDSQSERARKLLSAGNYEEALIALEDLYQRYPDDDALRRLMAEAEASFKDKAYRLYLPAHMIPALKTPLDQIEAQDLSPTEFFLLSRIDGTWDVKSIIQVAPIREIEALITLKRLRESGMIELRDPVKRD